MNATYKTSAVATGGRNGKVTSIDNVLELEVRIPKELGGQGGNYTNPEQLFAAGYAACFDSALNYVALLQKTKIQSKVKATVGLLSAADGFSLSVLLQVEVNGVDKETALALVEKAHQTCPYSKALKNNVEVKVELVDTVE